MRRAAVWRADAQCAPPEKTFPKNQDVMIQTPEVSQSQEVPQYHYFPEILELHVKKDKYDLIVQNPGRRPLTTSRSS